MRIEVWMAVILTSSVLSDNLQNGGSFSWGWKLSPTGPGSKTVGHSYYVNGLPQSQQHIQYTAEEIGYNNGIAVNATDGPYDLTHSGNLDDEASQLLQIQQNSPNRTQETSNLPYVTVNPAMDIYLLQNPYPSNHPLQVQIQSPPDQQYQTFEIPNAPTINYPYITQFYNIQTKHPLQSQVRYDNDKVHNVNSFNYDLKKLQRESTSDVIVPSLPVNQIFHNCTKDNTGLELKNKEIYSDIKRSKELFAEVPSYEIQNLDRDLGLRSTTNKPLTYRGAVHFRVETPRPNARNERFYYRTVVTPTKPKPTVNISQEGINKLVESTQDLITNEDLLKINHAVEKHLNDQSDDIIKPKPKFNRRQQTRQFLEEKRKNQRVKEKIRDIFRSDVKPVPRNNLNEEVLESNSNHYTFASPIVVGDTFYDSKGQIFDNIVSTMIPYIEDGYEIVSVRGSHENKTKCNEKSMEEVVNVTPRPLSEKYLAPITVGLRLLNANKSINSFDDFETSDTELVVNTVASPISEKTVVEIQESFPIDITHINDVEVHEYLEEGRSNNNQPFEAKSLYNKYIDALRSSKKIQDNMSKILYKYGTMNNYETPDKQEFERDYTDSKENLESSENILTEVEIKPENVDNNQRSEFVSYDNNYSDDNQKIIQPIIIEKEVPVTKFVDRFIEKEVPYAERVEVPVHVDRPIPVAVPIEKIIEKPVQVTRYVDKPYPVEVPRPYPVEVKVPYPVEQKVYIDRPIHIPYPVEKVVEQQIFQHIPVPTPVGIPYEVQIPVEHNVLYPIAIEKPVPVAVEIEKPVEKIVHKEVRVPYPIEKRVPYLVPYETKVAVPYPVEKIVEKPVTVTKIVEKPVHIEIPVPHPVAVPVHIPQPYPVDRIVEKNVPYFVPVERVVEKKIPVQVPYPVEKIVERIVHKPVLVTKYVDKPYPVEKRVPYPVEKIVERKVPYPVEVKIPYPVEKIIEKHVPIAVYRYLEKVDESKASYRYQKPENNQHGNFESNIFRDKVKNSNVQSTGWGNQYGSGFKYNNTQVNKDFKSGQSLKNYFSYLVNSRDSPYQYVLPLENQNHLDKSKNYLDFKMRRTDRFPRVTNLRVEYGGFKPPLVPSTEVDLNGLPVKET